MAKFIRTNSIAKAWLTCVKKIMLEGHEVTDERGREEEKGRKERRGKKKKEKREEPRLRRHKEEKNQQRKLRSNQ